MEGQRQREVLNSQIMFRANRELWNKEKEQNLLRRASDSRKWRAMIGYDNKNRNCGRV